MSAERVPAAKSRPARFTAVVVVTVAISTWLGGCSDTYYNRRDRIALSSGDAIADNEAEQTVSPWPPHSADQNISFYGQRMQSAVERLRSPGTCMGTGSNPADHYVQPYTTQNGTPVSGHYQTNPNDGAARDVVGIRRGAISDNMNVSLQAARSIC